MRQAVEGQPASSPDVRARLLAGLAQRRQRLQSLRAAAIGTLTVMVLAGIGAAITIPRLSQPGQHVPAQSLANSPSTSFGATVNPPTAPRSALHSGAPTAPGGSGSGARASGLSPAGTGGSAGTGGFAGSAGRGVPALPVLPVPGKPPSTQSTTASSTGPIYPSGTGYATPAGTVTPQTGPLPPTTIKVVAPPASPTPLVLTQSDFGERIDLTAGETLAVDLSGSVSMPWTEPASTNSSAVVRQSGSTDPSTGGAYGLFRASGTGPAQIVATADPVCLRFGCAIPSRLWRVTVDVTG